MLVFYSQHTAQSRVFIQSNLWSFRKSLVLKRLWINILETGRLTPTKRAENTTNAALKQYKFGKIPKTIYFNPLTLCLSVLHTSFLRLKYEQCLPTKLLSVHFSSVKHPCFIPPSDSPLVGGLRHSIDVGTASALTPADLPLDERDLWPEGSSHHSISSRQGR